jgi:hypothetical protein
MRALLRPGFLQCEKLVYFKISGIGQRHFRSARFLFFNSTLEQVRVDRLCKTEARHGEVSIVVHIICFVLACGAPGSGLISAGLVDIAALSHNRNCRGRSAGIDRLTNHASRPPFAQNLNTVFLSGIHLKS